MSNSLFLYLLLFMCLVSTAFQAHSQSSDEPLRGNVSYVTNQNVYVKFSSTGSINKGDTLFILNQGILIPALIVTGKSSTSCLCQPLPGNTFKGGEDILSKIKVSAVKPGAENMVKPNEILVNQTDTSKKIAEKPSHQKHVVGGSVSIAGYLNFSDVTTGYQRMRYTVNLHSGNPSTALTSELYMTFSHNLNDWQSIREDVFNGLKIYGFSVGYKFNRQHQVWFGRRINSRIANAGALDGIQYEYKFKDFTLGLAAGTRPDTKNYSFNASLPQAGGYLSHEIYRKNGNMQTTLAFMQQMNTGKTDRRFLYFQHVNSLVKNLYLFGSVEFDLYNQVFIPEDSSFKPDNSPKLSNLFVSLRYRPVRVLSVSVSYSERQNVIYYETYKDIVQSLLEQATVKGWVIQANVFPGKNVNIGLQGSFRNSKTDPKPTKSFYGYITFAKIPGMNASLNISSTVLQTAWLSSGSIFSASLNKDIFPGKLSGGIGYRYLDYKYVSNETGTKQHIPELNLNWRIMKKLSFSVFYEGTFEKMSNLNRIYLNLTQRF